MKNKYYSTPEEMRGLESWGFSWLEFVTSISAPMFLVTTYKDNGKTNACMQFWTSFTTGGNGKRFFAVLSSVNKNGHLYRTLKDKKSAVINFFVAEFTVAK